MLSRSAQGLYWMGRYLERTDHLCNLLLVQTEALVDRPGPRHLRGLASALRQPAARPSGGRTGAHRKRRLHAGGLVYAGKRPDVRAHES